jgi:hypothetical protein
MSGIFGTMGLADVTRDDQLTSDPCILEHGLVVSGRSIHVQEINIRPV